MATIAENLERIQSAKTDIKTAIEAKGVTVPSSATIDTYATYVSQISGGGGGSSSAETALKDLIERDITEIEIPSGITSIGEGAFSYCYRLESIEIPDSVTRIGSNAFGNCTILSSIDIPSGVTSIGTSAFYGCGRLTSCTIGSGVTSIGQRAFQYCTNLTSITINATTPPTLSNANAFNSTNNCPIYVPAESVSTYQSASGWSTYASRIQAIQT